MHIENEHTSVQKQRQSPSSDSLIIEHNSHKDSSVATTVDSASFDADDDKNLSTSNNSDNEKHSKGSFKEWLFNIIPFAVLVAGMIGLAYPVVADILTDASNKEIITTMSSAYDPLSDPRRIACLDNAKEYNDRLGGESGEKTPELIYSDQLKYNSITQMGWIEIPKINVEIPIYHGTSDDVLSAGVGHLESSSLPVGGKSSHCVLTGHSGMYNNKMFDDIRNLDIGDKFVVWTLGEPYAYEVYDIEVVLPEQTDNLKVQKGRDLTTLITCTPYGINTHRLLVHAERCDYDPEESSDIQGWRSAFSSRNMPFIIGVVGCALAIVIITVMRLWRLSKERRNNKNDVKKDTDALGKDADEQVAKSPAGGATKPTSMPKSTVKSKAKSTVKSTVRSQKETSSIDRIKNPYVRALARILYLSYPFALMLIGLIGLSIPMVEDIMANKEMSQAIYSMSSEIERTPKSTKNHLLSQAQEYNAELTEYYSRKYALPYEDEPNVPYGNNVLSYDKQLAVGDSNEIAWIEIPKIGVKLPIYRSASEQSLSKGAGHLKGTSLPVGGDGTHCVISAHSGMTETRMFDDIRHLEEGDIFTVWTLDEPYSYRVTGSETVLPEETEGIAEVAGKDLCTLLTCTPYGINTHRLLVHAERCDYDPDTDDRHGSVEWVNVRFGQFAIASIAVVVVLASVGVIRIVRYRKRRSDDSRSSAVGDSELE